MLESVLPSAIAAASGAVIAITTAAVQIYMYRKGKQHDEKMFVLQNIIVNRNEAYRKFLELSRKFITPHAEITVEDYMELIGSIHICVIYTHHNTACRNAFLDLRKYLLTQARREPGREMVWLPEESLKSRLDTVMETIDLSKERI